MIIQFTVPGDPVGKGRGRVAGSGTRRWIVTPARTQLYEESVAEFAREAMGDRPPLTAPCHAAIRIYLATPKGWTIERLCMSQLEPWHDVAGDLDNFVKSILDGMNGIVFDDDRRVSQLYACKTWDANPRVDVEIEPL